MSKSHDIRSSLERMKQHMALRGLRPNTVSTFFRCARGFLKQVGKVPAKITTDDVEEFLLDLARRGRSPGTRNVKLAAVRGLLMATRGPASRVITAAIPNATRQPQTLLLTSTRPA